MDLFVQMLMFGFCPFGPFGPFGRFAGWGIRCAYFTARSSKYMYFAERT
jgi:hypothetical protein